MDVQLNLFSADEEALTAALTTWPKVPESARVEMCRIVAALAIKHLQSVMERSESDESEIED